MKTLIRILIKAPLLIKVKGSKLLHTLCDNMNGGKISGMFNSMFGELLLDRDCANILDDPNADPMDKYVCTVCNPNSNYGTLYIRGQYL